jgi:hypothetical protein
MEESKDIFDIFNDDSAEQYELLKSKRIALNAKVKECLTLRKVIQNYSIY